MICLNIWERYATEVIIYDSKILGFYCHAIKYYVRIKEKQHE